MLETRHGDASRGLLPSRLRYHLRCLCEDATDPELPALERLALVRGAGRIREIRRELQPTEGTDSITQPAVGANRQPVLNARCDRVK
jgi:hypothetical protein